MDELALQYHKKTSIIYNESQRPNIRYRNNNESGGGASGAFETPEQQAMKKRMKPINENGSER